MLFVALNCAKFYIFVIFYVAIKIDGDFENCFERKGI